LRPQPPAPHAQELPAAGPDSLAALALLPPDLVRALKTESWSAPRLLEHFGQEADDLPESTKRS
jgi:hypothetical protein